MPFKRGPHGRKVWGGREGARVFQFWINAEERLALDRIAAAHDVPRAEVLRKLITEEDARLDALEELGEPL